MTTPTSPPGTDTPIVVKGVITDPKLVGYQLLTNYECLYWRALVGNEAWSLYEVLRSFCHEGHNVCYPSIRLLTEILGLRDKRVLIGRAKRVNGKEYRYPGLIEVLQKYGLVTAEVQGDEPATTYLFHVNLTPSLLTDDQLGQLTPMLQKKHTELVARCEEAKRELQSKRKPEKFPEPTKKSIKNGAAAVPRGVGISHGGGGKFPPEQQPINNTHRTKPATRAMINNNTGGASAAVVVALTQLGLATATAQRLVQRYRKQRVEEKIAFLRYLQQEQPEKVKNPRGWLRRAIEEDYGPPDGYMTAEERDRYRQEAESQAAQGVAQAEARQAALAAAAAEQAARLQRRREEYGATEDDVAFWTEAREAIRDTTTPHVYELVAEAELLQLTEDTVRIGVRSELEKRQLTHPGSVKAIERTLSRLAGQPLVLQAEVLA